MTETERKSQNETDLKLQNLYRQASIKLNNVWNIKKSNLYCPLGIKVRI
jgi:hypothetical protein